MYLNKCKVCGTVNRSTRKMKICEACGSNKITQKENSGLNRRIAIFLFWALAMGLIGLVLANIC